MKELISRQVVLAEVKAWFDDRDMDGSHLLAVLEQIPEEYIVRCYECKYAYKCKEFGNDYIICLISDAGKSPDDYCDAGVRKTNASNGEKKYDLSHRYI